MSDPRDVSEIIARIEAIDWQLSKPGAMALSRGWSKEEVAAWSVRANDARSYLVSSLVELRSELSRSLRAAESRIKTLAREKEAAVNALAESEEYCKRLRIRLDAALRDAPVGNDQVDAIVERLAALDAAGDASTGFHCGDRVVALAREEVTLRVQMARTTDAKELSQLKSQLRRLHTEQQGAMGAMNKWLRDYGQHHVFRSE